jgi:hypothetical protein
MVRAAFDRGLELLAFGGLGLEFARTLSYRGRKVKETPPQFSSSRGATSAKYYPTSSAKFPKAMLQAAR